MAFKALLKRMDGVGFTILGFRSSFRDWCNESPHVDPAIAEAELLRVTGNEVERA